MPRKIKKVPIDIVAGMTDQQASEIVDALEISGNKAAAIEQVKNLYGVFRDSDCTMVEVNPLAEDSNGTLIAADAKLGFDDNTAFRQKDIFAQRRPLAGRSERCGRRGWDLNYIGLDGSIGCMVNGAGLAMATMDIIQMHGGSPANFLDVGGSAKKEQIVEAFKIVTTDPNVKAILVNIFGGIMKCDVIAAGIVAGVEEVGLQIPLIVRLEGTNVDAGKDITGTRVEHPGGRRFGRRGEEGRRGDRPVARGCIATSFVPSSSARGIVASTAWGDWRGQMESRGKNPYSGPPLQPVRDHRVVVAAGPSAALPKFQKRSAAPAPHARATTDPRVFA